MFMSQLCAFVHCLIGFLFKKSTNTVAVCSIARIADLNVDFPSILGQIFTQVGDTCELGKPLIEVHPVKVPQEWRCVMGEVSPDRHHLWKVHMLPGPQADPDYFTTDDIKVRRPLKQP
jgi:hypothetical protein